MLLIYVRHGSPIYDPDCLTPLGHEQAEAIGRRLSKYGVDRIFSSTSNRAIQTAEPTSRLLKKDIALLDFCNESYAWSDFALSTGNGGRSWPFHIPSVTALFADKAILNNEKWYCDPRLPENNFEAGVKRIDRELDAWLLSLGYAHDREHGIYRAVSPNNERIALFAHQGFGLAFLSSLLDIPYPQLCIHFDIGHSDMTVIDFDDNDGIVIPRVLTHSNDGHLYAEGITTQYNEKYEF